MNRDVEDLALEDNLDFADIIRRLLGVDGRKVLSDMEVVLSLIPSFVTCSRGLTIFLNNTSWVPSKVKGIHEWFISLFIVSVKGLKCNFDEISIFGSVHFRSIKCVRQSFYDSAVLWYAPKPNVRTFGLMVECWTDVWWLISTAGLGFGFQTLWLHSIMQNMFPLTQILIWIPFP